ncbi:squalene/phytoene synthase family protein [Solemya velum gill symbiont]|uniref:squalene/phytoene synthase family protein n=2 Tax=Solemya velum gill symbiont TaxID=2340 RepID=UPI0015C39516|nr:squalene/phytoene synthase family protein [Solemya velum gill symbiont]
MPISPLRRLSNSLYCCSPTDMHEQAAEEYGFPNSATPAGSTAYYIVRFSPQQLQQRQALLFAWYRELQRLTEIEERAVASAKLAWWLTEITDNFDTSRHPLVEAMQQQKINRQEHLLDMLNGIATLVQENRFSVNEARLIGGSFSQLLTLPYTEEPAALETAAQVGSFDYLVRQLAKEPVANPAPLEEIELPKCELPPGPVTAQAVVADRLAEKIRRGQGSKENAPLELTPIEILWHVWRKRHAMRQ